MTHENTVAKLCGGVFFNGKVVSQDSRMCAVLVLQKSACFSSHEMVEVAIWLFVYAYSDA